MPTDAKGEYRLNSYGSKERPAGTSAWVLYGEDMSQAEIDAKAVDAAAMQERQAKELTIHTLLEAHLRCTYNIIKYADPASTAGQKAAALAFLQQKRAWIEANAQTLNDYLG